MRREGKERGREEGRGKGKGERVVGEVKESKGGLI